MVSKDRLIGSAILAVSVAIIVIYVWLLFLPPQWQISGMSIDIFLLKLTAAIAVIGVFGILAWIGYTLATTPPPKPIEEIEKELEEELKKLEKELEEKEGEKAEPAGSQ
jgi:predicted DNA-binding transcriptional regulator